MFVSFVNRETGRDVAFNSDDVVLVQKTLYIGEASRSQYGTDVTLSDGTLVLLSTQYDSVLNALKAMDAAKANRERRI